MAKHNEEQNGLKELLMSIPNHFFYNDYNESDNDETTNDQMDVENEELVYNYPDVNYGARLFDAFLWAVGLDIAESPCFSHMIKYLENKGELYKLNDKKTLIFKEMLKQIVEPTNTPNIAEAPKEQGDLLAFKTAVLEILKATRDGSAYTISEDDFDKLEAFGLTDRVFDENATELIGEFKTITDLYVTCTEDGSFTVIS